MYGVANEWANLTCSVSAEPPARFEWYMGNKRLWTSNDILIFNRSENVSILQVNPLWNMLCLEIIARVPLLALDSERSRFRGLRLQGNKQARKRKPDADIETGKETRETHTEYSPFGLNWSCCPCCQSEWAGSSKIQWSRLCQWQKNASWGTSCHRIHCSVQIIEEGELGHGPQCDANKLRWVLITYPFIFHVHTNLGHFSLGFILRNLVPNVTYFIRASARNAAASGNFSAELKVITPKNVPFNPPLNGVTTPKLLAERSILTIAFIVLLAVQL